MTENARPNWLPGQPVTTTTGMKDISTAELKTLPARNTHQAFIIGEVSRPGFHSFMREVEYTMYEPDTQANALFELILVKFPKDIEMLWGVMIVPIGDLDMVKKVGEKYSFRLSVEHTPLCVGPKGTEWFPIEGGQNVYTVQGMLKDEDLITKYDLFWDDVIAKVEKGLPWKI